MEKFTLTRQFVFEKNKQQVVLDDPDPTMPAAKVAGVYSHVYPELVTASVTGPEYKEDKAIYTFKMTVGTKG